MQSLWLEMNAQWVSESFFLTPQIQKQAVSLNSSEVYLSTDAKYGCDNYGELKN